jgi:Raf kinase inhibitor-like YbhB/YbcL family protein
VRDDGDVTARRWLSCVVVAGSLVAGCGSSPSGSGAADALVDAPIASGLAVTSPAFTAGSAIPPRYSCDGVSPPLSWTGVPTGSAELAVVVDDPDAPDGTYVHWVLFAIGPAIGQLAEGEVPAGARQARNSARHTGYSGPCPPRGDGPHHYRFSIYALGRSVAAADGSSSGEVLRAVRDAAISKGTLTATFDR